MLYNRFKAVIPEDFKQRVKQIVTTSHNPDWEQFARIDKKRIFVFLAGFYQNLGDMAITYTQVRFMQELYPESQIICVPSNQTYSSIKTIKGYISSDDLVTITGGGNMDDHYLSLENARLFIVRNFLHNRIVSFPQTICFSDNDQGKKALEKSKRVYERHNNLVIFAREKASYGRAKAYFRNANIELCPDIVLSLKLDSYKTNRQGACSCLRHDIESSLSDENRLECTKILNKIYHSVDTVDTVNVDIKDCQPDRYEKAILDFLNGLSNYRLVLSDRLHGMIFCTITGTPCCALDNKNNKISSVYETWLKDIPFIRVMDIEKPEMVRQAIEELSHKKYSNTIIDMNDQFESLRKALHE